MHTKNDKDGGSGNIGQYRVKDIIMNPIEWFYAKGDKHSGPVNSVELKRMAVAGELKPDDLVWREGMADWTVARNVRGLFDEENKLAGQAAASTSGGQGAPPKLIDPVTISTGVATTAPATFAATASPMQKTETTSKHLFDAFLDFVRVQFSVAFVESSAKLFATLGKMGLLAAMLLALLFAVLMTIKETPFNSVYLIEGAISFLVFAVLQYVGSRFYEAGERLNRSTSENLSSTAFLDCFALLALLSGAAGLIASIFFVIHGLYWAFLAGLAGFVAAQFLAFIAIHPDLLNIKLVAEMRASEEALGILSFLAKAFLRLAPFVFGAGVVFGSALLLYACVECMVSDPNTAWLNSLIASYSLRYAGAMPVIAYLAYLAVYLLLDVLRAILAIPKKQENAENLIDK
jgi:hypothetical protein